MTPQQYLRLFLTGIAMGASDIVPGVSGGTMAFILGVYENLWVWRPQNQESAAA
jgi:putative membrane protein